MMILYSEEHKSLVRHELAGGASIPTGVIWIDLHNPTREEELAVEAFLGMEIPTREEMAEIEISNRLYQENDALFMTATVVKADLPEPENHAITFVLCSRVLVTIRYVDTIPFQLFSANIAKLPADEHCGTTLLLGLLEFIVDRGADILERIGRDIDGLTRDIFRRRTKTQRDSFQRILERTGTCGDLASKAHESLVTFARLAVFLAHAKTMAQPANSTRLIAIQRDISGLNDHTTYLTGKVNFLLDATLGMISIDQNNVVKILSIASLVFMPPTLIAGIYGMNFKLLPELEWHFGYPMSLGLMLLSAILPYAFFKQKKWL